jgi:hypothetical protein
MRLAERIRTRREKLQQLLSWAGRALVWLWVPVTLIPVSTLMAGHLLTLPTPASEAQLTERLQAEAALGSRPGTHYVLHVLAEKCRCSQRVIEHLLARGPEPSFTEKVLLISRDNGAGEQFLAQGFGFERLTSEELRARYGIKGAPLMLVLGVGGRLEYSGGYSRRKQGALEDVPILRTIAAGGHSQALPLFGCAVSRDLQRELDPLELTYTPELEATP